MNTLHTHITASLYVARDLKVRQNEKSEILLLRTQREKKHIARNRQSETATENMEIQA